MAAGLAAPPQAAVAPAAAVAFRGVSKRFTTGTVALAEVDLTVAPGELVCVVGPSGCGKSTLLRLAAGLSPASTGEVQVDSNRVAYVFQEPTLLPWRSARRNVELLGELHRLPKTERRERAHSALQRVGLTGFEDALPAQLSGGMRMRVSLARALAQDPGLYLFDEPFGALDEITRLTMQDELQRLLADGSAGGLFITHSVSEAVYLGHRVVVMSGRPGRIVREVGVPFPHPRPHDLRFDPAFSEVTHEVSRALLEGHA